ncbi:MAG TPA: PQQ-binding-like beta-propeller repeat protein [Verrucomicrobiae bacterium]|nr:PQQ-binding-like beta-propeller repeat protein [Verrucomicrobiae bacterium]
MAEGRRASIRWWPAGLIVAVAVIAWSVLPLFPHRSQQDLHLQFGKVIFCSLAALVIWLLCLSRLRWKWRLLLLASGCGGIAAMVGMFRIRGVTGNLVPVLEPRWVHRSLQKPVPANPSPVGSNQLATVPGASDFPQFMGPNRNGLLSGPRLGTNWSSAPPQLLWRQEVGAAWSGFAVSGPFAVTQEQRGEEELAVCYDLLTGKPRWSHANHARYFTTLAGEGPRATPTISQSRVLVQGATGILDCLDLASGKLIWSKDIFQENQGSIPSWGHSSSPLVTEGGVIVNPGGRPGKALVAYRIEDGTVLWRGGDRGESYSSPVLLTLGGLRQVVLFADSLVGHDAATGELLWRFKWPGGHPHIAMPMQMSETDLVVSSGYGTGAGRIKIERGPNGDWIPTQVWRSNRMKAKFTNLVLHRGYLYALDDGIMACVEAETGTFKWKDGKYGHGQTLLVGEILLVQAENGEVVLVNPQPDQLHEITRFAALRSKTWNPPALAGEYLLVRNDKEAACFRVPVAH